MSDDGRHVRIGLPSENEPESQGRQQTVHSFRFLSNDNDRQKKPGDNLQFRYGIKPDKASFQEDLHDDVIKGFLTNESENQQ